MGIFIVNSNSFIPGIKKLKVTNQDFQNDRPGPTIIIVAGKNKLHASDLLSYHFFYSLAHCSYSLIRLVAVFTFIKFYFKKARVFLYIKGSVIVKSNLPVDP